MEIFEPKTIQVSENGVNEETFLAEMSENSSLTREEIYILNTITETNPKTGKTRVVDERTLLKMLVKRCTAVFSNSAPDGAAYDEREKVWKMGREIVEASIEKEVIDPLGEYAGGCLAEYLTAKKIDDLERVIYKRLKRDRLAKDPFDFDESDERAYMIPLADGVYNIKTNTMKPHEKYDYTLMKFDFEIPLETVEKPRSAKWIEYLADDAVILFQYIGYSFVRTLRPANYFMILTDDKLKFGTQAGGNGKSTVLNYIQSIFTHTTTFSTKSPSSNVSWKKITSDSTQFGLAPIANSFVNIDGEAGNSKLGNLVTLKALTAGDIVSTDVKKKSDIVFRSYAKLYFAMNDLPQFNATADAIKRRLLFLRFTRNLTQNPEEMKHATEIFDPNKASSQEYGQFVKYCIQEYKKIAFEEDQVTPKKHFKIEMNERSQMMTNDEFDTNDLLHEFFTDKILVTNKEEDFIPRDELKDLLEEYILENTGTRWKKTTIFNEIRKRIALKTTKNSAGKEVRNGENQITVNGARCRVFYGIKLIDDFESQGELDMYKDLQDDGEKMF